MTEALNVNQETARPEKLNDNVSERSRENFRRLEAAKDAEKEARIRAEMQAEQLKREMEEIKQMLKPKEVDPLDEVEDYVDVQRLKAKLEKEREAFRKEAIKAANEVYENKKKEDDQKNVIPKLKSQFSDYDQVMNEDNLMRLEQENPEFLEAVLDIKDDYKRRKLTYDYLKKSVNVAPAEPSIKHKVEENQRNPYYFESGSGTPIALDFDVKSPQARQQAYDKLKQAQRRPIGGQAL